jgi:CubicO group peptidase (beta-lactamase class C family)
VFTPLGMHTARVISEADIVANRAAGYQLVDGDLKNQEWYAPLVNTTADGALYLSLLDYLAWERGLRTRALLSAESWDEVYAPAMLSGGQTYPYGFGWNVGLSGGAPWYHHSGSSQGFHLYFSRYLANDLAIVVLGNLYESEPAYIVDGIAKAIDPDIAQVLSSEEGEN